MPETLPGRKVASWTNNSKANEFGLSGKQGQRQNNNDEDKDTGRKQGSLVDKQQGKLARIIRNEDERSRTGSGQLDIYNKNFQSCPSSVSRLRYQSCLSFLISLLPL